MPQRPNRRSGQRIQRKLWHEHQSGQISAWRRKLWISHQVQLLPPKGLFNSPYVALFRLHFVVSVLTRYMFTHKLISCSPFPLVFLQVSHSCWQLVAFSSKSGGKSGKHCYITESSTIAAVSNIAVQLFQYRRAREFRLVTEATLLFQTKQYLLIPSIQFLCLLDTKFPSDQALSFVEVTSDIDMECFKALKEGKNELISAIKLSRKRGGGLNFEE
jgi:hypothetical protein